MSWCSIPVAVRGRVLLLSILALLCLGPEGPTAAVAAGRVSDPVQWQRSGLGGTSVHSVAAGSKSAGLLFAGTATGIFRQTGGAGWKRVLKSDSVGAVTVLPDDRTVLACDNSGNVDISTDRGTHWRQRLVTPLGVFAVVAQPGNPRLLLAGASGGVYLSRDGGSHWQQRYTMGGAVGVLAWAPGSKNVVFAGSSVISSARHGQDVLYSRDAGVTWHVFGTRLEDGGAVMSLTVTSHQVFVGTMGNAVWRASRTLKAWEKVAAGMPEVNNHGTGLVAIPGRPGTLYASTLGFGVFRTTDGGAHWKDVSTGLLPERAANVVRAITYASPRHTLFVGTDDGVYLLNPV